jgi:hypothetical protein
VDTALGVLISIFVGICVVGMIISELRKTARAKKARQQWRSRLISKYGDEGIADDILSGLIRQGMSLDMVIEAWGQPAAVDRKVYRTKVRETLKYGPQARRTFANKVHLEDGIVVGWEGRNGSL